MSFEVGANPLTDRALSVMVGKTTVVDHATRDNLFLNIHTKTALYGGRRSKEVDVVWTSGPLHEMFPQIILGNFDAVIASRIRHIPNPIGFLVSCHALLKPTGRIIASPSRGRAFCFRC